MFKQLKERFFVSEHATRIISLSCLLFLRRNFLFQIKFRVKLKMYVFCISAPYQTFRQIRSAYFDRFSSCKLWGSIIYIYRQNGSVLVEIMNRSNVTKKSFVLSLKVCCMLYTEQTSFLWFKIPFRGKNEDAVWANRRVTMRYLKQNV